MTDVTKAIAGILAAVAGAALLFWLFTVYRTDSIAGPTPQAPAAASPKPTEVDLPGQGRAYILCDGGNRVYFSPDGGVAVTLDRNECP